MTCSDNQQHNEEQSLPASGGAKGDQGTKNFGFNGPADLLGKSFACECGKTHAVPIHAVVYCATAIKQCLRTAGAAHCLDDIGCTRDRFLTAAHHAHQMRERYTIIDLARAVGILPGAAGDIVDEYLIH